MKRTRRSGGPARVVVLLVAAGMVLSTAPTARAAAPGPVLPEGVDRDTVKAIDKGMNYLAKTQRQDGSWLNSGGYGMYPAVMTALASTALIAGGSTPESGPHMRIVTKGMN